VPIDDDGKVRFFATPEAWRKWLAANHRRHPALWVGFHKRATGRPSITWPQSVDQALCFGWIDGIRKRIDENTYKIRFTPRKPTSIWSAINVKRVKELTKLGLMQADGLAAFERRNRTAVYSYEQTRKTELAPELAKQLRANARAWAFLQERPPWYRRTVAFWVMSAKREETRQRRLATLIAESAAGRTVGSFTRPGEPPATGSGSAPAP
jgi:uncharacterized protein YdeI (YjbR/CyaY-like superfamily)